MYGCEPTLEELLNEPIIRKVMVSDGVNPDHVRRLMGMLDSGTSQLPARKPPQALDRLCCEELGCTA